MTTPLTIQETTKGQAICPYCGVGCRLFTSGSHEYRKKSGSLFAHKSGQSSSHEAVWILAL